MIQKQQNIAGADLVLRHWFPDSQHTIVWVVNLPYEAHKATEFLIYNAKMKQQNLRTLNYIETRNIPLLLAIENRHKGFRRVIEVISPQIIEKVIASNILAFQRKMPLFKVFGKNVDSLRIV